MKKFLLGMAACCLAAAPVNAAIVINEFAYDDAGTDDEEFIELYNSGASAVDISGYVLDLINGNGNVSYGTITIPAATSLAANDYYLIVCSTVLPAKQPATVDLVASVSSIQNGLPDAILLKDAGAVIIDRVGYGTNQTGLTPNEMEGAGIYGTWNGTGIERTASIFDISISRVVDGQDTNDNVRDFAKIAATPGTSNTAPAFASALPYSNDFNAAVATSYPEFWGRFVDPHAEDPTAFASQQPGASPGGGNAAVFSDTSGGGDSYQFNNRAYKDWTFEAYVYLNSALQATYIDWEIGIGNTDESLQYRSTVANYGSRGLFWRYSSDDTSASISLIERYSNTERTVGTPVAISSGSNDGWQRLYLSRTGTNALGIVGGTLGNTGDGTQITDAAAESVAGGFYVGFREGLATNNSWLWIDNISLTASDGASGVGEWSLY